MSGLRHYIGSKKYEPEQGQDEGAAVVYPALDGNDREFVSEAVKMAGYERGWWDGWLRASQAPEHPPADPHPARHLKLHCAAALKAVATEVAAAGLTAAAMTRTWLDGYEAGRRDAWQGKGQAFMMGDPDGGAE